MSTRRSNSSGVPSSCIRTGVEMLYGRLATTVAGAPSPSSAARSMRRTSPSITSTCGASAKRLAQRRGEVAVDLDQHQPRDSAPPAARSARRGRGRSRARSRRRAARRARRCARRSPAGRGSAGRSACARTARSPVGAPPSAAAVEVGDRGGVERQVVALAARQPVVRRLGRSSPRCRCSSAATG